MDAPAFITDNMPEIALAAGAVLSILIAITYLGNNASIKYRLLVFIGVVVGALMMFSSATQYESWEMFSAILVAVAGFTLAIRPFREIHFAVLFALLVMVVVYILLGQLAGTQLEVVSSGWPRIIVAFVAGALVHMMLHFAESVIKLFGKLFNCWPILVILGIVCALEALSLFLGHGSLYSFFK